MLIIIKAFDVIGLLTCGYVAICTVSHFEKPLVEERYLRHSRVQKSYKGNRCTYVHSSANKIDEIISIFTSSTNCAVGLYAADDDSRGCRVIRTTALGAK